MTSNGTPRPNLVTVVLDCVRAKSLRVGGGEHVATTPTLDELGRRGTTFAHTVAPSNWTVPSHMSMMTGVYPARHQLRTFRKGEPRFETMATWLGRQGYDTALFSEQVHLAAGFGIEAGYAERFSSADRANIATEDRNAARQLFSHSNTLYSPTVRRAIEALPPLVVPINAVNYPSERAYKSRVCNDRMVESFERWVAQRPAGVPFHAFVNLVNGHEPYGPTSAWGSLGLVNRWMARTPRYYLLAVPGLQGAVPWAEFEGGYLLAIEEADRKIARLLAALERVGALANTYFMVTSDHGQSFGESGHVFHGNGAVEAVTRVPMVVRPPDGVSLPRRVDRWVSLTEIPSWWKAAASGQPPYDDAGRAPFPFSAGAPEGDVVYCEGSPASDSNRSLRNIGLDHVWNHRLLAAYLPDEKLVLDTVTGALQRWTDLKDADAGEPSVLTGAEAAQLRERVFAPYERSEEPLGPGAAVPEVDASVDERLRSWGYD